MGAILGLLANAGVDLVKKFVGAGEDKAVEVIKEKTGIDLSKKDTLNKDDIIKLKEFESKNKDFLLKQMQMFINDKQNARDMQKEALKQDDKFSKRFIYYFAFMWSLFAMIYMGFITFYDIPAQNIRFADTIQGFLLGTIVAQIIAFFYGSSIGSKEKTNLLKGK